MGLVYSSLRIALFKDSHYYARMFAQKIPGIVESIPLFPESGKIAPKAAPPVIRLRFKAFSTSGRAPLYSSIGFRPQNIPTSS